MQNTSFSGPSAKASATGRKIFERAFFGRSDCRGKQRHSPRATLARYAIESTITWYSHCFAGQFATFILSSREVLIMS